MLLELPVLEFDYFNNYSRGEGEIHHASDIMGQFGPFQKKIFIIQFLLYLVVPFQNMGMVFQAPDVDFSCQDYDNSTMNSCEGCSNFVFNDTFWRNTLTQEFDLVCDRSWVISFSKSIYQFGYLVASIFTGLISDRFGRKVALKFSIILELFASLCQALSFNIYQFLTSRLFLGIAAYSRFLASMLLLLEIV